MTNPNLKDIEKSVKKCPKWIQDGFKEMKKDWGLCEEYFPNCAQCVAWRAFIDLVLMYEE